MDANTFKVGDTVTFRYSDKKPKLTVTAIVNGKYVAESVDGVSVICEPRELRRYK